MIVCRKRKHQRYRLTDLDLRLCPRREVSTGWKEKRWRYRLVDLDLRLCPRRGLWQGYGKRNELAMVWSRMRLCHPSRALVGGSHVESHMTRKMDRGPSYCNTHLANTHTWDSARCLAPLQFPSPTTSPCLVWSSLMAISPCLDWKWQHNDYVTVQSSYHHHCCNLVFPYLHQPHPCLLWPFSCHCPLLSPLTTMTVLLLQPFTLIVNALPCLA